MESDLLLRNPGLVTKYQYQSNYLGIPTDQTDDWCFTMKNGTIKELKQGGVDCELMVGISYWTAEDGRTSRRYLPSRAARSDSGTTSRCAIEPTATRCMSANAVPRMSARSTPSASFRRSTPLTSSKQVWKSSSGING